MCNELLYRHLYQIKAGVTGLYKRTNVRFFKIKKFSFFKISMLSGVRGFKCVIGCAVTNVFIVMPLFVYVLEVNRFYADSMLACGCERSCDYFSALLFMCFKFIKQTGSLSDIWEAEWLIGNHPILSAPSIHFFFFFLFLWSTCLCHWA